MEKPVGKEYAGPSGIGRESNWLTNEDLVEGRDVQVVIKRSILYPEVKFLGGRTRYNFLGVEFVGKERVLGLNATNRKILDKMFSNVTEAWKGKTITLYVSETQLKGETVKCLRIRDRGSRAATVAEEFLGGEDDPKPVDQAAPPASGVSEPVTFTTTGATPADEVEASDEVLIARFRGLADRVNASFNGERPVIKQAPKGSGQWWTCDSAIADPAVKVYDGNTRTLAVSREQLAQYSAALQELVS